MDLKECIRNLSASTASLPRSTPRFAALALLFGLMLLATAPLSAQSSQLEDVLAEGRGYFMAGIHSQDLSGLNGFLDRRDLPTFSESRTSIGGGGHVRMGPLHVGGEGHALVRERTSTDNFERTLTGGYGFFNLGYHFSPEERVDLYPMVGIGGGGNMFSTVEVGAPSFGSVVENPRRGATLNQAALLLQAAVGTDYLVVLDELPGGRRGFMVGLRAGYTVPLWESDWDMEEFRVTGGPGVGPQGFYLRVLIGGVGRVRDS
jgi:opacity protein-like surface antigen